MCTGKTTLGRALSRSAGIRFVDLDQAIIEASGASSVSEIFVTSGETGFRRLESEVLRSVIADAQHAANTTIIACGGGTPCHADNMDRMLRAGLTVHLTANEDRLVERLVAGASSRPLVAGRTPDQIRTILRTAMADRLPHYSRAHLSFDTSELEDADQIVRTAELFSHLTNLTQS